MHVVEKLPFRVAPVIDVDAWLETQTQPRVPLIWEHDSEVEVRNAEHLSVLLSSLAEGDHGLVRWHGDTPPLWAQTMRVDDNRWIIEAFDGADDGFVQRVFRGEPGDYPPRGDRDRDLHPFEQFPPYAAAAVIWSWLHGALPEGCARTLNYLSPSDRRRWGLDG